MKNSRYKDSYIVQMLSNGSSRKHLSTRRNIKIERNPDDIIHKFCVNEALDLLAYMYYGDEKLWWVIAEHNNIKTPHKNLDSYIGSVFVFPNLVRLRKKLGGI